MIAWLLTAALVFGAPAAGGPGAATDDGPKNVPAGACPVDGVCTVPAAPAPILLFVALDGTSEDGCSQSSETSHEGVTLTLEVGPTDDARLRLERTRRSVLGPSPGEYRKGGRDFSTYVHKDASTWTGRARREPDGLALTFTTRQLAEVRFLGPGDLPLPAPRDITVDLRVDCRLRTVAALAAVAPDTVPPLPGAEAPVPAPLPVPALVCSGLEVLDDGLRPYLGPAAPGNAGPGAPAAGIPFGRGTGLWVGHSRFFWDESLVVRRTAAEP